MEHGAAVDAIDDKGRTSLCHAARYGSTDCIHVLAEYGADVFAVDEDGLNPLEIAEQNNRNGAANAIRKLEQRQRLQDKRLLRQRLDAQVQFSVMFSLRSWIHDTGLVGFIGQPNSYWHICRGSMALEAHKQMSARSRQIATWKPCFENLKRTTTGNRKERQQRKPRRRVRKKRRLPAIRAGIQCEHVFDCNPGKQGKKKQSGSDEHASSVCSDHTTKGSMLDKETNATSASQSEDSGGDPVQSVGAGMQVCGGSSIDSNSTVSDPSVNSQVISSSWIQNFDESPCN